MEVAPARGPSLVPFGNAATSACPGGSYGPAGELSCPAPLISAVPHPLSRPRESTDEEAPAVASAAPGGGVPEPVTPPPLVHQPASGSSQSNGCTVASDKKPCPFRNLLNCRQPAGQGGSSRGEEAAAAAAPTAAAAASDAPPTPPQAADCAVPSDGVYTGGPLSSAHCSRSVLQGGSWGNGDALSSRESSLTMSAKLRGRVVEVALNMTGGKKVLVVLFGGVMPALALTAMGTAHFLGRHNSGDCPRPQAWLLVCTISCTLLTLFSCALTKYILQPHVNCASFLTSLFFHLYLVYCACMGLWIRVDPRESLYITKPESSCPLSYHDTLLVKAPIWSIIGLLGIPVLLPVFHSPLFLKRVSCPELDKADDAQQADADETAAATAASAAAAAAAAGTPATGTPVPVDAAGARCGEEVEFGVGGLPQSAFFGGGATTATVQEVGAAAGVVAEMTVCFDRHLQVSLEETKTRIEQLISGLNGHGRAKRPSTSFEGSDAREVDVETVSLSLADAREQGPYHAAEADDDFDDDSSSLQSGTL